MARALGGPGIVLDLEVYNHSDGYRVEWIAQRQGKTPAEVIAALENLGARLADITGAEFPHAVLWSLFTAVIGAIVVLFLWQAATGKRTLR